MALHGAKGAVLFREREQPPFDSPRERLALAVSGLKGCGAWGMEVPAVAALLRSPPLVRARRLVVASTTRCRSAYFVLVQPNHRLPIVRISRRAQQSRLGRQPIAQRVQLFKCPTANAGVEGDAPRLSLGISKGVFSSEREYPPFGLAAAFRAALQARAKRGECFAPMQRSADKKEPPFRAALFKSLFLIR